MNSVPLGTFPRPLPVIVFIHGEGHQIGSASEFGPYKFMREGIVLVTLDYRLGIIGEFFISKNIWTEKVSSETLFSIIIDLRNMTS